MIRLFVVFIFCCGTLSAAVWQWSVEIKSLASEETKGHPRAYLWIPEDCAQVRGVVLGQQNMLEEGVLEHDAFRRSLAETGFAAVWVTPAFDGFFRFDQGAGDRFQEMMTSLAKESGYGELERAPILPIGHSAMASFPYHFGAWNPERTLAAISLKGTWPHFRDANSPVWKDGDLNGVPLLFVSGEYESAEQRAGKALEFRRNNPSSPLTMLADAGGGHFDLRDELVEYLGFYVKKVGQHRLGKDLTGPLVPINPENQGWLVDRWRRYEAPRAEPAPIGAYQGKADETFWCFDREHALATAHYGAEHHLKQPQLAGYVQDGKVVPQDKSTHQQVTLDFRPIDDGLTFRLAGTFLDRVPEGRPVGWTDLAPGAAIGHAAGTVTITKICGPVEKLADDTFAIRFGRVGFDNSRRSNEIWLMATHPGDGTYKRCVQQALLRFPLFNHQGEEQRIEFAEIPDQNREARSLELIARANNSEIPVRFYVREGPAVVEGSTLKLTAIPPRARFPVKVTVVAWHWGRSIEPKLQTAKPVERTFLISE